MFVGVSSSSLCVRTCIRIIVNSLFQLIIVHLVAILTLGLLAIRLHHLIDSQTLRFDSFVRSLDCLQHHTLRHFFHLAFHHHDVVIRSGNHQFKVSVLALLESGVNHHLTVYACNTYFAHRTFERNIRASQRSTCSETGNALRHVNAVSRIHSHVDKGFCMVVRREKGTKGAVDKACYQDFIIRSLSFATGKSTREASCGREFFFVLYCQGHEISARDSIFCGADSSQNHRVTERCHHSTVGLLRQFACLQFDYSSVRKSNLFGNNIHQFLFVLGRRLRPVNT